MIIIKTYQDLIAVGENEQDRMDFILSVINEHKASPEVKAALTNEKYYEGENTTINNYFKIIYDFTGKAHKDNFSANHKIASNFLGLAVDQEVSYLLSNGVNFSKAETLKKLGADFENTLCDILTSAEVQGVCFGFWNLDHLEMFPLTDQDKNMGFVPLYDENTGALAAGIRYWQLDADKPLKASLYEINGITEYKKDKGGRMEVLKERQPYKNIVTRTDADGEVIVGQENYSRIPIIPLKYNKKSAPAIQGKRSTIDALDLATSNMINNVDEANLIYWVLTNCGDMDEMDDVKFLEQLKMTHVVHADGDNGAKAEAHSVEIPTVAVDNAIQTLTRRLYTDFQAFDASIIAAGNQTATAIRACYVPLDLKADKTERQVTDFVLDLLELIGIDDKPAYTRNQIVNKAEETQALLLGAEHYSDDYITKKLLAINGDIDMFEEMQKQKSAEEINRFETQQFAPEDEQQQEE